jgi:hypothetical protein
MVHIYRVFAHDTTSKESSNQYFTNRVSAIACATAYDITKFNVQAIKYDLQTRHWNVSTVVLAMLQGKEWWHGKVEVIYDSKNPPVEKKRGKKYASSTPILSKPSW